MLSNQSSLEQSLKRLIAVPLLSALLLALAACASRGPAPLDDRSTALEREEPVVADAPQPVLSGIRSASSEARERSVTARTSDSSASQGSTARTQPVTTDTGVRVSGVDLGGGVRRAETGGGGISRDPIDSGGRAEQPRSDRPGSHTVSSGETLYSIAWMYDLDYRRLAVANDLSPPYTIYPDQRLSLDQANVPEHALRSMSDIPAAPAGGARRGEGERPQAAMAQRRQGNVPVQQVEGVRWQWPVDGRVLNGFSVQGSRGIDIATSRGQPVYAAANGDVVYAGRGIQGAGNLIILRHSARHLSAYMYNSNMLVSEGARIRAGDKIAETGSAPDGRDLLHFEIRVDGEPTDPARFLPNR